MDRYEYTHMILHNAHVFSRVKTQMKVFFPVQVFILAQLSQAQKEK